MDCHPSMARTVHQKSLSLSTERKGDVAQ